MAVSVAVASVTVVTSAGSGLLSSDRTVAVVVTDMRNANLPESFGTRPELREFANDRLNAVSHGQRGTRHAARWITAPGKWDQTIYQHTRHL
ncbi:hypothetical protein GCM10009863_17640 [Streptomyces axinellae]|uniref:Uncharacterized protein n=1 Tax=Streptomyces axinellae TaxID=552788 RepID=A0ABN3PXU0_9ACTN